MIELRAATPDDASVLLGIYGPYVVGNAVSFEATPPSSAEMAARIESGIATHPWIAAVDADSDFILGYASAKPLRPGAPFRFAVETGCYVAGDLEGQGIRRSLYAALLATLTEQNFTQAISNLVMPQDKAIQLHEAMGFKRAGVFREVIAKNGHWIDIGIWQRALAEPKSPPEEPRAFADVGVVRS